MALALGAMGAGSGVMSGAGSLIGAGAAGAGSGGGIWNQLIDLVLNNPDMVAGLGGTLLGAGMHENPEPSVTTTTGMPPEFQAEQQRRMMNEVSQLFGTNRGIQAFTGPRVAGNDALTRQGQQQLLTFAEGVAPQQAQEAQGALSRLLSPEMLDPSQQPGMQGVQDDITRRVEQDFLEGVLPEIGNRSVSAGTLGSNRDRNARALAASRSADNLAGQLSELNLGQFQTGLQGQLQALNMAPSIQNMSTVPGSIMTNIGTQRTGMRQRGLDAQRAEFEEQQMAPYRTLQQILPMLSANFGRTQRQEQQHPSGSPLMSGLGLGTSLMGAFGGGG